MISKYFSIFTISWNNGFVYRMNFMMWRLRMVLQMVTVLYFWGAILQNSPNAFGYSTQEMLTYLIGISVLRSLVLLGRTTDIQSDISTGNFSNLLLKPINVFSYWWSQDVADKILNLIFTVFEVGLVLLVIKPSLLPPTTFNALILSLIAATIAMVLYFFFSLCISFTTFWLSEGNGWPQRFFALTLLEFLAGGLFPLDILPSSVTNLIKYLPTTFMLYTPMQIYLGRLALSTSLLSIILAIIWTFVFIFLAKLLLVRGIKNYGAYGR